jgi:hypothetical protein
MSTLASQQQALLDALFSWPPDNAMNNIASYADNPCAGGLKAYQANGHAAAERAVQAAYPVLTQLLGLQSVRALARAYWHAEPPVRGDMAQWGAALADFVRASEQLAAEPYLADVATVEWALHVSASAADQAVDVASFALLTQQDPSAVQLCLAPGCAVLQSAWPVASIVAAHLHGSPTLAEVGRRLRAGLGECAVVWRQGLRPQVAPCSTAEAAFLQATQSGASVLSALAHAGDFAFHHWLPAAVQSGVVVGVWPLAPSSIA